MAYKCDLGEGQQVFIDNRGMQTVVTLSSSSPGQQQQASTSFQTGKWSEKPSMFRTGTQMVLQVESEQGKYFVHFQAGGMSLMSGPPDLNHADKVSLEEVSASDMPPPSPMAPMAPMKPMEPMKPMKPMEPMKPMKPMEPGSLRMGNMEMNLNPMEMRMGNMSMQIGSFESTSGMKRFCSQCGAAVTPSDRFCSSCGYRL